MGTRTDIDLTDDEIRVGMQSAMFGPGLEPTEGESDESWQARITKHYGDQFRMGIEAYRADRERTEDLRVREVPR